MTTRSLTELSKAVMEKLGKVDANSTVEAADHTMIVDRYTELMEGLRFEDIAYWTDTAIPLLVFPALTDLVALHSQSAFGRAVNAQEFETLELTHKRRLRRYTHKMSAKDIACSENY